MGCYEPFRTGTHARYAYCIGEVRYNRYAFCCVAVVGEKVIPLPVRSCSEGIVSYPELANQPFRRSHFHHSENALSKS